MKLDISRLILPYVGLLALLALPALARSGQNGEGAVYRRAVADARKAGLPTEAKDLQAPLPPANRNAAPLYTQLGSLLKAHPVSPADKNMEQLSSPLTADEAKRIRDAQRRRSDIMALIHQAAARPECVFVRNWSNPVTVTLPEYRDMRMAARYIRAESAVLAWDGKPLEAVKNQALGFRIARHAATDPMLISYLVGVAIDAITLAGMQHILCSAGNSAEVDDAVLAAIEKEYRPLSLAHALRTEIGTQIGALRVLRKQGPGALDEFAGNPAAKPGQPRPLANMDPQAWNRFVDDNGLYMLQEVRKMVPAADRAYPEANRVLTAVETEVEKADSPRHLLCTIMWPVYTSMPAKRAAIQATANITLAGAAVLAWKARHKAFPPDLKSAMQMVPTDPYNGNPLRYRRTGNGFVVYSVGPTGKFDGGQQNVKPASGETRFFFPESIYPKTNPSPTR